MLTINGLQEMRARVGEELGISPGGIAPASVFGAEVVEECAAIAGDRLRVSAGRDLYVGARAGVVVGERALIYAKGGYTNARFNTHYTSTTSDIEDHDTVGGFRVGAGAEVKLNDKLYLKGEYRYSKYDSDDVGVDAKRHQVLGGVGVRF